MQKFYVKPQLVFYGTVKDITHADGLAEDQDGIFASGVVVGHASGSTDACISTNLSSCG